MSDDLRSVPQRLTDLSKLYEQRNTLYGDGYKNHGKLMLAMFPHGIELHTLDDFNRFAIFQMIAAKLDRYAVNWDDGHIDSLDDISVYAQMLQELDADLARAKKEEEK